MKTALVFVVMILYSISALVILLLGLHSNEDSTAWVALALWLLETVIVAGFVSWLDEKLK